MIPKQKWENRCVVCEEIVTNPICISCLNKEIKQWLTDKKRPDAFYLIKKSVLEGYFVSSGTECIICSSKISLCAHCYLKEVYHLLRKNAPELITDFILHFNYGLDHEHEHYNTS